MGTQKKYGSGDVSQSESAGFRRGAEVGETREIEYNHITIVDREPFFMSRTIPLSYFFPPP